MKAKLVFAYEFYLILCFQPFRSVCGAQVSRVELQQSTGGASTLALQQAADASALQRTSLSQCSSPGRHGDQA